MAPLLTLLDELFKAADSEGRAGMQRALDAWSEEHRTGLADVVSRAVPRLSGARRVATLSWSSTVAGVLAECERGLEVVISESRPGAEGRRMATRLQALGHRIVFASDSAFPGLLGGVEVLLIGADALTPQGLVNKVGSLPAAREMHAGPGKVLSLLDRSKVLGAELAKRLRIHPEPASLVWENAPEGVSVQSMLFECVPLELVDEVLGPKVGGTPAEVLAGVGSEVTSPRWADVPPCPEGTALGASAQGAGPH